MNRTHLSALFAGILILSLFTSFAVSKPSEESEPNQIAVFHDIWHTPRYPFGYEWDAEPGAISHSEGWGGDIINVYANVTTESNVYITYGYCHELMCVNGEASMPDDMDFCNVTYVMGFSMNYLGGTLYNYTLIGDYDNRMLPTYTASYNSSIHVYYTIYAKNHTLGEVVPGVTEDMGPYWPSSAVNVFAEASESQVHPGSIFTINGSANYWHHLNWDVDHYGKNRWDEFHEPPNPPCDETNVTVTIDGTPYQAKTDIEGNFSVDIIAPLTPGFYMVNTTVLNDTYNRNIPGYATEIIIEVLPSNVYDIDVSGVGVDEWIFVSFPIEAYSDPSIIFDDTYWGEGGTQWDYIQWYDPLDASDHWKTYASYKPPDLNDLPNVDNSMGFWIHLTANGGDQRLTIGSGEDPTSTPINLYTGWNLVGYPAIDDSTYSVTDLKTDTGATRVEGYNPGAPYDINTLGDGYVLQRGEGLWVFVPVNTVWNVDW
jgi:hypothetical protein